MPEALIHLLEALLRPCAWPIWRWHLVHSPLLLSFCIIFLVHKIFNLISQKFLQFFRRIIRQKLRKFQNFIWGRINKIAVHLNNSWYLNAKITLRAFLSYLKVGGRTSDCTKSGGQESGILSIYEQFLPKISKRGGAVAPPAPLVRNALISKYFYN